MGWGVRLMVTPNALLRGYSKVCLGGGGGGYMPEYMPEKQSGFLGCKVCPPAH